MYVWVILSNLLQVVAGKSQNPHLTGVPGKLLTRHKSSNYNPSG